MKCGTTIYLILYQIEILHGVGDGAGRVVYSAFIVLLFFVLCGSRSAQQVPIA